MYFAQRLRCVWNHILFLGSPTRFRASFFNARVTPTTWKINANIPTARRLSFSRDYVRVFAEIRSRIAITRAGAWNTSRRMYIYSNRVPCGSIAARKSSEREKDVLIPREFTESHGEAGRTIVWFYTRYSDTNGANKVDRVTLDSIGDSRLVFLK